MSVHSSTATANFAPFPTHAALIKEYAGIITRAVTAGAKPVSERPVGKASMKFAVPSFTVHLGGPNAIAERLMNLEGYQIGNKLYAQDKISKQWYDCGYIPMFAVQ